MGKTLSQNGRQKTPEPGTLGRLFRLPVLAEFMEQRALIFILSGVGALQLLLLGLGFPAWRCPFRTVTGRLCPGCGMSRAFLRMFQGEWEAALRLHPFAPFFFIGWLVLLAVALLPSGARGAAIETVRRLELKTRLTGILLLAFSVYGLIRMIF